MCILIAKPANTPLPSIDILHRCYINNPDGMGFAIPGVEPYHTLNFYDFYNTLNSVDDDLPMIIHFRLATHGSVCESNCHPFRDDSVGVSFAHNGVLPIHTHFDLTDSETAFRSRFVPAIKDDGKLGGRNLHAAVRDIIGGSKFAFLDDDGNLRTYGCFIKDNGILYSNKTYKSYRFAYI